MHPSCYHIYPNSDNLLDWLYRTKAVEFIPGTARIFDVEEICEAVLARHQKLEAWIVTANNAPSTLGLAM